MAHTLGLRATSFVISAALLGFSVLAALSITISLQAAQSGAPDVIESFTETPTPPPKPPEIMRERPPAPPLEGPVFSDVATAPLPPIDETPAGSTWQPPIGPVEITSPRWLRRPSDLGVYYPSRALQRGMTGEAMLDCRVLATGALSCVVASETPAGWGFGAAALRIARDHRMAPAMRDGVAIEGRYRMRVPFEVR